MLRALIFDCDGVLVNSEPVHFRAFVRVLSESGVSLTESEYLERYLAMDDRGCFQAVFHDRGGRVEGEELVRLMDRKSAYYAQEMQAQAPTFPGVVEFVRGSALRHPLAIASGALRHEVEQAVRLLGIRDCFRCLVTAEDVARGKPDPEAYRTACVRLNALLRPARPIRPAECLVVEDSFHGVRAAKNAGMRCMAVTNSYPAEKLSEADWVVARLGELHLRHLAEAMGGNTR
ncbi:MAG: HAD family phosphatase [Planctomycetes bacterium]|nr:HAD family phosphatase [Planctomycetota bacterium]